MGIYHYGTVIKEYREKCSMTQARLAERWPKSDSDEGVNIRYVQDVEAGKKHITDPMKLRKISTLLDIPLWKFGLSEYDPFNPQSLPGHGERMFQETLDVVESLIQHTLAMRSTAPLPEVEKNAQGLQSIFDYFLSYLPPPARLERRFLQLFAQEQSVAGLMHYERKRYSKALETFEQMYSTATQINDPALIVHALQKVGVELNRAGRTREAIESLERARDISFQSSKHVAAFANAYLAHVYTDSGDGLRFERTIETALALAEPIKETYGNGTDYIHQRISGILSIRARGYVRIQEPTKMFAMQAEVKQQIGTDNNLWMNYRLALYRARAYLMQREVEASISAARESFRDAKDWKSPHRVTQAYTYLREVEENGYANVSVVQAFREELKM